MQRRIVFLILLSMLVILASLWAVSSLSVQASIERSLENRLAQANILGRYFDQVLESNLKRLYDISLSGKIDFSDRDWEPEKKALRAAYEYSIFTDRIFLLDRSGRVVISYPHREPGEGNLLGIPYVRKTLNEQRPVVSDVYTLNPTQKKVIFALVPLRNKNGDPVGVAGGEIDPTNYLLGQVIRKIPAEPESHIELMDSRGVIICSSDPRRILTCNEQNRYLNSLIAERRPAVANCHGCKDSSSGKKIEKQTVAFAPLSMAPWGISVRDPAERLFSPSSSLKKGFLLLGIISILAALFLALGLSRSLVHPIHSLIAATQRISRGNLSEPVRTSSADEIGILSQSFDRMRVRLAESLESIQQHNLELERRVAERTRELQRSREKLERHLREIITAEEEERKRIARELHDDTSQSLNATLITLDSAIRSLPEADPVRGRLVQVREQCMGMLKGVHRLIKDLRPPVLDDLGLESAVQWVLEKHVGEKGILFQVRTSGSLEELRSRAEGGLDFGKVELVLFRVIQEAITNASKHAEASQVSVSLAFGDSGIEVEIEDDGIGFDPSRISEEYRGDAKGLGLLGMEERVGLLDGTLRIDSAPGRGTRILVHVPVGTREG